MKLSISLISLAGALALAAPAVAQEPIYYPAKGQSSQQVDKDKFDCQGWAKGQTGFDPMSPAPTPDNSGAAAAQQATQGSAVRGSARGAARGAAIGAIAGDAGKGAAIGAGTGAVRGRAGANRNASNAQAQANADYEARLSAYNAERSTWQRAAHACMEGRGYTVK